MFSVRIVTIDHYQSPPIDGVDPQYCVFRGAPIHRVPVLRIFGSTPAGQKTCLHIHGVFPYLLVPYDETEPLSRLTYTLALAIDKALNVLSGRSASAAQHVFRITPVSGVPFYGYHGKEHQFLKIFFYNPSMVKKAAELLQNGVIQGKVYQPHESHVPFILQFLMDHNLHGMNFIHLSSCYFRRLQGLVDSGMPSLGNSSLELPTPSPSGNQSLRPSLIIWTSQTIPGHSWLPEKVGRVSTCELEVDGQAEDILNLLQLKDGHSSNPGLAHIWEEELARCHLIGASRVDIEPSPSPPRNAVEASDSDIYYRKILCERVQAALKTTCSEPSNQSPLNTSVAAETPDGANLAPATRPDISVRTAGFSEADLSGVNRSEDILSESQVDETLIRNLTQNTNSQWMDSCDRSLLAVMEVLADGSQMVSPDESDAILSTQRPAGSHGEELMNERVVAGHESENEEEETIEMTQTVWDSATESPLMGLKEGGFQEGVKSRMSTQERMNQSVDLFKSFDFSVTQLDGQSDLVSYSGVNDLCGKSRLYCGITRQNERKFDAYESPIISENVVIMQLDGANDPVSKHGSDARKQSGGRQMHGAGRILGGGQYRVNNTHRASGTSGSQVFQSGSINDPRSIMLENLQRKAPICSNLGSQSAYVIQQLNSTNEDSSQSYPFRGVDFMDMVGDAVEMSSLLAPLAHGTVNTRLSDLHRMSQPENSNSSTALLECFVTEASLRTSAPLMTSSQHYPTVIKPVNVTPLSGVAVRQSVPGIGSALVVPALVTHNSVSVTGLSEPMSPHLVRPSQIPPQYSRSLQLRPELISVQRHHANLTMPYSSQIASSVKSNYDGLCRSQQLFKPGVRPQALPFRDTVFSGGHSIPQTTTSVSDGAVCQPIFPPATSKAQCQEDILKRAFDMVFEDSDLSLVDDEPSWDPSSGNHSDIDSIPALIPATVTLRTQESTWPDQPKQHVARSWDSVPAMKRNNSADSRIVHLSQRLPDTAGLLQQKIIVPSVSSDNVNCGQSNRFSSEQQRKEKCSVANTANASIHRKTNCDKTPDNSVHLLKSRPRTPVGIGDNDSVDQYNENAAENEKSLDNQDFCWAKPNGTNKLGSQSFNAHLLTPKRVVQQISHQESLDDFRHCSFSDTFDFDYDVPPQTPGSFLAFHEPGNIEIITNNRNVRRLSSYSDNNDWQNVSFECPPTPGMQVTVPREANKTCKIVNKNIPSDKYAQKSLDSDRCNNISLSKRDATLPKVKEPVSKKSSKMHKLFGPSSPTRESCTAKNQEMPMSKKPIFNMFDNPCGFGHGSPERPVTPGREMEQILNCGESGNLLSNANRNCGKINPFMDPIFDLNFMPDSPIDRPQSPSMDRPATPSIDRPSTPSFFQFELPITLGSMKPNSTSSYANASGMSNPAATNPESVKHKESVAVVDSDKQQMEIVVTGDKSVPKSVPGSKVGNCSLNENLMHAHCNQFAKKSKKKSALISNKSDPLKLVTESNINSFKPATSKSEPSSRFSNELKVNSAPNHGLPKPQTIPAKHQTNVQDTKLVTVSKHENSKVGSAKFRSDNFTASLLHAPVLPLASTPAPHRGPSEFITVKRPDIVSPTIPTTLQHSPCNIIVQNILPFSELKKSRPMMSPIPPTPVHHSSPTNSESSSFLYSVMTDPYSILSPMPMTPSCQEELDISDPVQVQQKLFPNLQSASDNVDRSVNVTSQLSAISPIPPTPCRTFDDDFALPPMMSPMPVYPSVGTPMSPLPRTPAHLSFESFETGQFSMSPSMSRLCPNPLMSPILGTPMHTMHMTGSTLVAPMPSPLSPMPQTPHHSSSYGSIQLGQQESNNTFSYISPMDPSHTGKINNVMTVPVSNLPSAVCSVINPLPQKPVGMVEPGTTKVTKFIQAPTETCRSLVEEKLTYHSNIPVDSFISQLSMDSVTVSTMNDKNCVSFVMPAMKSPLIGRPSIFSPTHDINTSTSISSPVNKSIVSSPFINTSVADTTQMTQLVQMSPVKGITPLSPAFSQYCVPATPVAGTTPQYIISFPTLDQSISIGPGLPNISSTKACIEEMTVVSTQQKQRGRKRKTYARKKADACSKLAIETSKQMVQLQNMNSIHQQVQIPTVVSNYNIKTVNLNTQLEVINTGLGTKNTMQTNIGSYPPRSILEASLLSSTRGRMLQNIPSEGAAHFTQLDSSTMCSSVQMNTCSLTNASDSDVIDSQQITRLNSMVNASIANDFMHQSGITITFSGEQNAIISQATQPVRSSPEILLGTDPQRKEILVQPLESIMRQTPVLKNTIISNVNVTNVASSAYQVSLLDYQDANLHSQASNYTEGRLNGKDTVGVNSYSLNLSEFGGDSIHDENVRTQLNMCLENSHAIQQTQVSCSGKQLENTSLPPALKEMEMILQQQLTDMDQMEEKEHTVLDTGCSSVSVTGQEVQDILSSANQLRPNMIGQGFNSIGFDHPKLPDFSPSKNLVAAPIMPLSAGSSAAQITSLNIPTTATSIITDMIYHPSTSTFNSPQKSAPIISPNQPYWQIQHPDVNRLPLSQSSAIDSNCGKVPLSLMSTLNCTASGAFQKIVPASSHRSLVSPTGMVTMSIHDRSPMIMSGAHFERHHPSLCSQHLQSIMSHSLESSSLIPTVVDDSVRELQLRANIATMRRSELKIYTPKKNSVSDKIHASRTVVGTSDADKLNRSIHELHEFHGHSATQNNKYSHLPVQDREHLVSDTSRGSANYKCTYVSADFGEEDLSSQNELRKQQGGRALGGDHGRIFPSLQDSRTQDDYDLAVPLTPQGNIRVIHEVGSKSLIGGSSHRSDGSVDCLAQGPSPYGDPQYQTSPLSLVTSKTNNYGIVIPTATYNLPLHKDINQLENFKPSHLFGNSHDYVDAKLDSLPLRKRINLTTDDNRSNLPGQPNSTAFRANIQPDEMRVASDFLGKMKSDSMRANMFRPPLSDMFRANVHGQSHSQEFSNPKEKMSVFTGEAVRQRVIAGDGTLIANLLLEPRHAPSIPQEIRHNFSINHDTLAPIVAHNTNNTRQGFVAHDIPRPLARIPVDNRYPLFYDRQVHPGTVFLPAEMQRFQIPAHIHDPQELQRFHLPPYLREEPQELQRFQIPANLREEPPFAIVHGSKVASFPNSIHSSISREHRAHSEIVSVIHAHKQSYQDHVYLSPETRPSLITPDNVSNRQCNVIEEVSPYIAKMRSPVKIGQPPVKIPFSDYQVNPAMRPSSNEQTFMNTQVPHRRGSQIQPLQCLKWNTEIASRIGMRPPEPHGHHLQRNNSWSNIPLQQFVMDQQYHQQQHRASKTQEQQQANQTDQAQSISPEDSPIVVDDAADPVFPQSELHIPALPSPILEGTGCVPLEGLGKSLHQQVTVSCASSQIRSNISNIEYTMQTDKPMDNSQTTADIINILANENDVVSEVQADHLLVNDQCQPFTDSNWTMPTIPEPILESVEVSELLNTNDSGSENNMQMEINSATTFVDSIINDSQAVHSGPKIEQLYSRGFKKSVYTKFQGYCFPPTEHSDIDCISTVVVPALDLINTNHLGFTNDSFLTECQAMTTNACIDSFPSTGPTTSSQPLNQMKLTPFSRKLPVKNTTDFCSATEASPVSPIHDNFMHEKETLSSISTPANQSPCVLFPNKEPLILPYDSDAESCRFGHISHIAGRRRRSSSSDAMLSEAVSSPFYSPAPARVANWECNKSGGNIAILSTTTEKDAHIHHSLDRSEFRVKVQTAEEPTSQSENCNDGCRAQEPPTDFQTREDTGNAIVPLTRSAEYPMLQEPATVLPLKTLPRCYKKMENMMTKKTKTLTKGAIKAYPEYMSPKNLPKANFAVPSVTSEILLKMPTDDIILPVIKRKRGRPRGSKYKNKNASMMNSMSMTNLPEPLTNINSSKIIFAPGVLPVKWVRGRRRPGARRPRGGQRGSEIPTTCKVQKFPVVLNNVLPSDFDSLFSPQADQTTQITKPSDSSTSSQERSNRSGTRTCVRKSYAEFFDEEARQHECKKKAFNLLSVSGSISWKTPTVLNDSVSMLNESDGVECVKFRSPQKLTIKLGQMMMTQRSFEGDNSDEKINSAKKKRKLSSEGTKSSESMNCDGSDVFAITDLNNMSTCNSVNIDSHMLANESFNLSGWLNEDIYNFDAEEVSSKAETTLSQKLKSLHKTSTPNVKRAKRLLQAAMRTPIREPQFNHYKTPIHMIDEAPSACSTPLYSPAYTPIHRMSFSETPIHCSDLMKFKLKRKWRKCNSNSQITGSSTDETEHKSGQLEESAVATMNDSNRQQANDNSLVSAIFSDIKSRPVVPRLIIKKSPGFGFTSVESSSLKQNASTANATNKFDIPDMPPPRLILKFNKNHLGKNYVCSESAAALSKSVKMVVENLVSANNKLPEAAAEIKEKMKKSPTLTNVQMPLKLKYKDGKYNKKSLLSGDWSKTETLGNQGQAETESIIALSAPAESPTKRMDAVELQLAAILGSPNSVTMSTTEAENISDTDLAQLFLSEKSVTVDVACDQVAIHNFLKSTHKKESIKRRGSLKLSRKAKVLPNLLGLNVFTDEAVLPVDRKLKTAPQVVLTSLSPKEISQFSHQQHISSDDVTSPVKQTEVPTVKRIIKKNAMHALPCTRADRYVTRSSKRIKLLKNAKKKQVSDGIEDVLKKLDGSSSGELNMEYEARINCSVSRTVEINAKPTNIVVTKPKDGETQLNNLQSQAGILTEVDTEIFPVKNPLLIAEKDVNVPFKDSVVEINVSTIIHVTGDASGIAVDNEVDMISKRKLTECIESSDIQESKVSSLKNKWQCIGSCEAALSQCNDDEDVAEYRDSMWNLSFLTPERHDRDDASLPIPNSPEQIVSTLEIKQSLPSSSFPAFMTSSATCAESPFHYMNIQSPVQNLNSTCKHPLTLSEIDAMSLTVEAHVPEEFVDGVTNPKIGRSPESQSDIVPTATARELTPLKLLNDLNLASVEEVNFTEDSQEMEKKSDTEEKIELPDLLDLEGKEQVDLDLNVENEIQSHMKNTMNRTKPGKLMLPILEKTNNKAINRQLSVGTSSVKTMCGAVDESLVLRCEDVNTESEELSNNDKRVEIIHINDKKITANLPERNFSELVEQKLPDTHEVLKEQPNIQIMDEVDHRNGSFGIEIVDENVFDITKCSSNEDVANCVDAIAKEPLVLIGIDDDHNDNTTNVHANDMMIVTRSFKDTDNCVPSDPIIHKLADIATTASTPSNINARIQVDSSLEFKNSETVKLQGSPSISCNIPDCDVKTAETHPEAVDTATAVVECQPLLCSVAGLISVDDDTEILPVMSTSKIQESISCITQAISLEASIAKQRPLDTSHELEAKCSIYVSRSDKHIMQKISADKLNAHITQPGNPDAHHRKSDESSDNPDAQIETHIAPIENLDESSEMCCIPDLNLDVLPKMLVVTADNTDAQCETCKSPAENPGKQPVSSFSQSDSGVKELVHKMEAQPEAGQLSTKLTLSDEVYNMENVALFPQIILNNATESVTNIENVNTFTSKNLLDDHQLRILQEETLANLDGFENIELTSGSLQIHVPNNCERMFQVIHGPENRLEKEMAVLIPEFIEYDGVGINNQAVFPMDTDDKVESQKIKEVVVKYFDNVAESNENATEEQVIYEGEKHKHRSQHKQSSKFSSNTRKHEEDHRQQEERLSRPKHDDTTVSKSSRSTNKIRDTHKKKEVSSSNSLQKCSDDKQPLMTNINATPDNKYKDKDNLRSRRNKSVENKKEHRKLSLASLTGDSQNHRSKKRDNTSFTPVQHVKELKNVGQLKDCEFDALYDPGDCLHICPKDRSLPNVGKRNIAMYSPLENINVLNRKNHSQNSRKNIHEQITNNPVKKVLESVKTIREKNVHHSREWLDKTQKFDHDLIRLVPTKLSGKVNMTSPEVIHVAEKIDEVTQKIVHKEKELYSKRSSSGKPIKVSQKLKICNVESARKHKFSKNKQGYENLADNEVKIDEMFGNVKPVGHPSVTTIPLKDFPIKNDLKNTMVTLQKKEKITNSKSLDMNFISNQYVGAAKLNSVNTANSAVEGTSNRKRKLDLFRSDVEEYSPTEKSPHFFKRAKILENLFGMTEVIETSPTLSAIMDRSVELDASLSLSESDTSYDPDDCWHTNLDECLLPSVGKRNVAVYSPLEKMIITGKKIHHVKHNAVPYMMKTAGLSHVGGKDADDITDGNRNLDLNREGRKAQGEHTQLPGGSHHSPGDTNQASERLSRKNGVDKIFSVANNSQVLVYVAPPPTFDDVMNSQGDYRVPEVDNLHAFCSNPQDLPAKPVEVGGHLLKLKSTLMSELPEFEGWFQSNGINNWRFLLQTIRVELKETPTRMQRSQAGHMNKNKNFVVLTPLHPPPSPAEVTKWSNARQIISDIVAQKEDKKDPDGGNGNNDGKFFPKERGSGNGKSSSADTLLQPVASSGTGTSQSSMKQFSSSSDENSSNLDNVSTSTPYHKASKVPQRLLLTPIMSSPISLVVSHPKLKSKRRVSWDTDTVEPKADAIKQKTSCVLPNDLVPLQEDGIDCEETVSKTVHNQKQKCSSAYSPIQMGSSPHSQSGKTSLHRQLLNTQFRQQFLSPSSPCVDTSQVIEGPSLNNTCGFKMSNQDLREAKALQEHEYLTLMCLECHSINQPNLLPNPSLDPICAVFFSIVQDVPDSHCTPQKLKGSVIVSDSDSDLLTRAGITGLSFLHVDTEKELFEEIVEIVKKWDPDILVGYEVQMSSWGYLLERGTAIGLEIISKLSRVPEGDSSHYSDERDEYGADHTSQIHVSGRIVLNVWRLMRAEVALQSYTLENVAFHVLHNRIPTFSCNTLRQWWNNYLTRSRTVEHYLTRCNLTMKLLERLDLINRTAELARLFGIQFYDVLSRGSQFRVESMMLRLTRSHNLVAVSPSVQQRANMKAPEWIALNLEPKSKFYTDPVVVLDFQSLYPSIMIAYNYCFSTCLGRVNLLGSRGHFPFGASLLHVSPEEVMKIVDQVSISPCGVAFVPSSLRQGVLPQMLQEILNTRIMVKNVMKKHKDDPVLQRVLHARQLGLKLISNVTYGYTSANFSGRMPCTEVGDSIVSKSRETLERAIRLVNGHPTWGARVVYGDTDSLFVHLPNRSRQQAFVVGREIAEAVTQANPQPVKLRFEKVYLPCILQTKKRYVGYMFESEKQTEPVFEAKGIETVRRDGCPAVSKILEKSLRVLFESRDVSQVKLFVQLQFSKLMQGRVSLQDLIFAKEYRGARGYRAGACVPALELARQWTHSDPRLEPRLGERVPYVIVYGAPGLPLIRLVRAPQVVLEDPSLRPNALYYITRAILPPLQRCFLLLGVDVNVWFSELPRPSLASSSLAAEAGGASICHQRGTTIMSYFARTSCLACGEPVAIPAGGVTCTEGSSKNMLLCCSCLTRPQATVMILNDQIRNYERAFHRIGNVCHACLGRSDVSVLECISLDCPINYRRHIAADDMSTTAEIRRALTFASILDW